jgi:hypothetical protein
MNLFAVPILARIDEEPRRLLRDRVFDIDFLLDAYDRACGFVFASEDRSFEQTRANS